MRVLDSLNRLPRLGVCRGVVTSSGEVIHADELVGESVEHGRELAWGRVVVVLGVVSADNVHVALEQTARFLAIVGAVDPRVVAHRHTSRELQFGDLGLDDWVRETELLDCNHLVDIDGALKKVRLNQTIC